MYGKRNFYTSALLWYNLAIRMPESPEKPERRKNPHAVALGRRGGLKGGKARAAKLSSERRSAIARIAAKARWEGKD